MLNAAFSFLELFENNLWEYLCVPLVFTLGIFLTFYSNFFQIRNFPKIIKTFLRYFAIKEEKHRGVHPLKAFFACVGGCVGIGNVVGICTAVQIGGPGALFWIWVTAIFGMMVKYAEVYLGVKHRVANKSGGYDGGPMYFLQKITAKKWVPLFVCVLLCVYGVEVYQFSVITESVSSNWQLDRTLVAALLLVFVIFAGSGGVRRVGNISSAIIPVFVVIYMVMGLWVLVQNLHMIPSVVQEVFTSAFTGSSAAGGFVGSTLIMTLSNGVKRGCYTADVGVGYASVIHSETESESPSKQASLVIVDIFLDTFIICTMSVLLVLVSGAWRQPMPAGMLVQTVFSDYFPMMDFFMPFFLFLLGYSTITAYFVVGLKCADFISPAKGRYAFYFYSVVALILATYVDTTQAQSVMAISGGLLLLINCWGIFRLRDEVSFDLDGNEVSYAATANEVCYEPS